MRVPELVQPLGQFVAIDVRAVMDGVEHIAEVCSAFHRCSVLSQVQLNRTKCVCSCGSRAREDVCRNAAPTRLPVVRSWSSMPPLRMRVAANCSSSRSAMVEASWWASMMRWSFIVTARIDTDLGGEQHGSRRRCRRSRNCCGVNCSPVIGCRLSQSRRNASRVTTSPGCNPNRSAPMPIQ